VHSGDATKTNFIVFGLIAELALSNNHSLTNYQEGMVWNPLTG
jgi:hypothetical protein